MANEGIANQISLGIESSIGTPVVPNFSVPILPSDGIRTEQEAVGVEAIDTTPARNKAFVRGVRNYPGSFELNAYPEAIGYFLLSALGSVSSDEAYGETTVYEHDFTETVAKKSLTVEQVIGDISERFAGYIASGFNLGFNVGEPVTFSTPGMALSVASSTKISPAYESAKPFKWDQITSISIGGTDIKAYCESGNIEYTNGLSVFHGFGSNNEPTSHYVGQSEVNGSLTLFLDGSDVDALLDTFRDQDLVALTLSISGDSVGNAENLGLVVNLPAVAINAYNTQLDTGYNQVTLDFVGSKHETDGLISVTLTNEVASYA